MIATDYKVKSTGVLFERSNRSHVNWLRQASWRNPEMMVTKAKVGSSGPFVEIEQGVCYPHECFRSLVPRHIAGKRIEVRRHRQQWY